MEIIRQKTCYEGCFVIDNLGHSGGLAMLWKKQHWVVVVGSSRHFIDLEIDLEDMGHWRLTGFYGCPEGVVGYAEGPFQEITTTVVLYRRLQ